MSSAASVASDGWYSFFFAQPLQSPPLLPWMISIPVSLTQSPWPGFGILLSGLFGTASVPLLFLVARSWMPTRYAWVAATLLALSDFHAIYSRMVLTDVPLTFWFLLAMLGLNLIFHAAASTHDLSSDDEAMASERGANRNQMIQGSLLLSLAGAAAWNTKYNGWMILAISLTAIVIIAIDKFLRTKVSDVDNRPSGRALVQIGACVGLATLIAAASFVPWYLFVERQFPGGYAAVNENHRSFFGGPAAWPSNAWRLLESLPALRHFGWAVSTALLVVSAGWIWIKLSHTGPGANIKRNWCVAILVAMAFACGWHGVEAILFLLAPLAVFRCLYVGGWERVLPATWCAAFIVLTPLYHPYPRLLLPALPATICTVVWLFHDVVGWPVLVNADLKISNRWRGAFCAAIGLALMVMHSQPFPILPTARLWECWNCHQSYRAFEQAMFDHTKRDDTVICQGMPMMALYAHRTTLIVENEPFTNVLDSPAIRGDCFLAVDFQWLYQQKDSIALSTLIDQQPQLTVVATIPNDLNLVSLLDHMTPRELVAKLTNKESAYFLPAKELNSVGLAAPPPLNKNYHDCIVIYRVRR
jgi:Dolichyl-phosphate-mannose-protein mannosyltransferase